MLHALIRFSDLLVVDRKPRYRRPPSKLYADIQQSTPLGSSLQSLAQRASINNKTTQKSSSLQSLAQRAAGQRGMSALQTLASRQQQQQQRTTTTTTTTTTTNTATTTTTSSSPKPSSLAALAQKSSANKGRTSLAHLATRSRPSETSTRPSSSNQGLSGLAKLAKSNVSDKPTLSSSSLEKQQHQQPVKETMKDIAPTKAFHITNDQPANPLCAKPSAAANFLFMHMYPEQSNTTTPTPIPAFSSIGQVFYEAVKTSDDTIQVFSFDVPSPDDIVMEAQSQRSGGQLRKS